MPQFENDFTKEQISQFLAGTASKELREVMLEDLRQDPDTGAMARALAALENQATRMLDMDLRDFEDAGESVPEDAQFVEVRSVLRESIADPSNGPRVAIAKKAWRMKEWVSTLGAFAASSLVCFYLGSLLGRKPAGDSVFVPASSQEDRKNQSVSEWLTDSKTKNLTDASFMVEFARDHANEFRRWHQTLGESESQKLRKSVENYINNK